MDQMVVDYKKIFFVACIILQILDGIFTGYGVLYSSLGVEVEGNPLVKLMMSNLGVIPGLFIVKGVGIYMLSFLYKIKTPTPFFMVIFGLYFPVILLWMKVIFVDNLIV